MSGHLAVRDPEAGDHNSSHRLDNLGASIMLASSSARRSLFEQFRRLDLYYVDNWSLLHDLGICLRTFGVVARGRGAA